MPLAELLWHPTTRPDPDVPSERPPSKSGTAAGAGSWRPPRLSDRGVEARAQRTRVCQPQWKARAARRRATPAAGTPATAATAKEDHAASYAHTELTGQPGLPLALSERGPPQQASLVASVNDTEGPLVASRRDSTMIRRVLVA